MAQENGFPPKLIFDARDENALDVVRRVFMNRIRTDRNFDQLGGSLDAFFEYVDIRNKGDYTTFSRLLVDVFWEFVNQGVISPGTDCGDPSPPSFHLTEYGKRVVQDPDFQPRDPAAFLAQLGQSVTNPDSTVMAYLDEALHCFTKGAFVASAMMLGIAAERVFLLVCDALLASLQDPAERTDFHAVLARNQIKPKLDWVTKKFQKIQTPRRPPNWPEDVDIKIPGIFNMIRCQRNELGHPRPSPPSVTRDDAYGYLRIFPSYYATAEKVRNFLQTQRV